MADECCSKSAGNKNKVLSFSVNEDSDDDVENTLKEETFASGKIREIFGKNFREFHELATKGRNFRGKKLSRFLAKSAKVYSREIFQKTSSAKVSSREIF